VDFVSAYPCPVALRRSGGAGTYGLCAMELLNVMTRPDADPETKYSYITDVVRGIPEGVHGILRDQVIWFNDVATQGLSDDERADLLWPILPSVLGTGNAYLDEIEFFNVLTEKGLGGRCHPDCSFDLGYGDIERTTDRATQILKGAIREFYSFTQTTPLQSDYTPKQIDNLHEWMGLGMGKGFLRKEVAVSAT
jgi:hypothetical protein